ncbi:hypothetical protein FA15DRAFT_498707 [Coprinopsis marcescibilis]|uniref:Uncharacterized protein n=1 Tax=Coprinopsis marcescibilis TaxID=230819 RepID=A0A5C3KR34_COPMA|nr:hypothetical protein FA15DRAFT_498707 [Coprinopsis marcescibilis]
MPTTIISSLFTIRGLSHPITTFPSTSHLPCSSPCLTMCFSCWGCHVSLCFPSLVARAPCFGSKLVNFSFPSPLPLPTSTVHILPPLPSQNMAAALNTIISNHFSCTHYSSVFATTLLPIVHRSCLRYTRTLYPLNYFSVLYTYRLFPFRVPFNLEFVF